LRPLTPPAALTEAGEQGIRRIAVNYEDDAVADVFLRSFDPRFLCYRPCLRKKDDTIDFYFFACLYKFLSKGRVYA